MSGHAKAASADLEIHFESKRKADAEIHSVSKREADAKIHSESDEEPVSQSLQRKVYRSFSFDDEQLSKRMADSGIDPESDEEPVSKSLEREAYRWITEKKWITKKEWMDCIKGNPKDRVIFSSHVSIFKVGMFLKDIKREAYVPQRVSLGPYHHRSPDLPPMNHTKGRAVRRMMIRFNNPELYVQGWKVIFDLVNEIRAIYQEDIDCDRDTLARMLCLDGCFILELLRTLGRDSNDPNDPNEKNDPIFGENKVAASKLLKDILMLENQIPWIVLLKLLGLVLPTDEEHRKDKHVERTLLNVLMEGTCGLFKFSGEDKSALMQWDWLNPVQGEVHHLLGFLHKVIVHRPFNPVKPKDHPLGIGQCLIMLQGKSKASNDIESIPRAVELKHAGIKFRPCKGSIKEIIFDRNSATIYLPRVSITYGTEVLFHNLLAFEICRPSEGNYVTSYVGLMNDLIDSERDVALLRSVGILRNLLRSDKEVADLFNGLRNEGTVRIENFFDELRKNVNALYKPEVAELVREHFSSPWKALALVAAFFLLILALIQTIFTIINK